MLAKRKFKMKDRKILKILFSCKSVTRPKLQLMCRYPASTIYRLVEDLLRDNYLVVSESDEEENGKGRPTSLVSLNPSFAYIFSIHIARTYFSTALVDGTGVILDSFSHPIEKDLTPSFFLDVVGLDSEKFCKQHHMTPDDIYGIGLSAVGPLDYSKGNMLNPIHFGAPNWHDVPIVDIVSKRFNKPVVFNCNARACLMGLYLPNYYQKHANIGYATIGIGIGSAIIRNRELVTDRNSILDGLAHMVIDINGQRCNCGEYGCLETFSTTLAITEQCVKKLRLGRDSLMSCYKDQLTFQHVCIAIDQNDPLAMEIVQEAALVFAKALCNYLRIVELDAVILGGELVERVPLFYSTINDQVKSKNPHIVLYKEYEEDYNILKGIAGEFILNKIFK